MSLYYRRQQKGFTLLEVLVAITITAVMSVLAFQSFDNAITAQERTQIKLDRIGRLDRAWITIETDLRNSLARGNISPFGDLLPAFTVDPQEDYWLSLVRGGKANPLHFPRSELSRVAYRLEDGVVWRDSWIDPGNPDEELAYQQKLLDGVEEITVRVMARGAKSVRDGPWLEEWPPAAAQEALPQAIEITFELEQEGEIIRLFAMVPGL